MSVSFKKIAKAAFPIIAAFQIVASSIVGAQPVSGLDSALSLITGGGTSDQKITYSQSTKTFSIHEEARMKDGTAVVLDVSGMDKNGRNGTFNIAVGGEDKISFKTDENGAPSFADTKMRTTIYRLFGRIVGALNSALQRGGAVETTAMKMSSSNKDFSKA